MLFKGKVLNIVFSNVKDCFYILNMNLGSGMETVTGNIYGLTVRVGSYFSFEGKRTKHPKFGDQIKITLAPSGLDNPTTHDVIQYLDSMGFSILDWTQVSKALGEERFLSGLQDSGVWASTGKVTPEEAENARVVFTSYQFQMRVIPLLGKAGLPPSQINKLYRAYGGDMAQRLNNNPWEIVTMAGFTFELADQIAQALGVDFDLKKTERLGGAIYSQLMESASQGHLFLPAAPLFTKVRESMGGSTSQEIGAAIQINPALYVDRNTAPSSVVYIQELYALEKDSAEKLCKRFTAPPADSYMESLRLSLSLDQKPETLEEVASLCLESWSERNHLKLNVDQRQGILNALCYQVSVISGLPGTGKSTSLLALVQILSDAHVPFLIVAPTGIAAKRVHNLTQSLAYTVHRAFGAKGTRDEEGVSVYAGVVERGVNSAMGDLNAPWEYSPEHPHMAEVVIVDESSMLDQHLLYRILNSTDLKCKLVFVGDAAQLPSVGPGNVFRSLVQSKCFPTVSLTEIYRQKNTSDIVYAAHDIHKGEVPSCLNRKGGEFALIPRDSEPSTLQTILDLSKAWFDKGWDFQVLSPVHKGDAGVTNLNDRLRELLNPAASARLEAKLPFGVIREGDRVRVVQNDYDLNVVNGDIGKVHSIERGSKMLFVQIEGFPKVMVGMDFDQAARLLRLGYACTVHASQGLEYDRIILPLLPRTGRMLNRNLLYTAVTRAKKQVVLVGDGSVLTQSVKNSQENKRNSLLIERLVRGLNP